MRKITDMMDRQYDAKLQRQKDEADLYGLPYEDATSIKPASAPSRYGKAAERWDPKDHNLVLRSKWVPDASLELEDEIYYDNEEQLYHDDEMLYHEDEQMYHEDELHPTTSDT